MSLERNNAVPYSNLREQIQGSMHKKSESKVSYDLQRASKIQDMFQKYLKDDDYSRNM